MWKSITIIPAKRVPIIMKGDSGYIAPNNIRYESGYYDSEFRPLFPWLTYSGDSILDGGVMPTHWMYISELEELISRGTQTDTTR